MEEKKGPPELFAELVEMAAHLRGPEGCAWDRKQTYETIIPHFLEEAHEAVEELAAGNLDGFKEEVGDIIFLAVFLVRIAEEEGHFEIADSLRSIIEKMKRRHPHVYGDKDFRDEEELHASWEEAKRREKGKKHRESLLDGVPGSLPALLRARRVQQKAASIGFDWTEAGPILDKIDEEVGELRQEFHREDHGAVGGEIGDLLFSVVNLARYLGVDPEEALNRTIRKFRSRFLEIEKRIDPASPPPLEVLDRLWEEAKGSDKKT